MAEEYCPECGAKITGSTGFCPECGAVTTSLENQIKETERINREEKQKQAERKRQAREKRINSIKKNKYYIIGILIVIIAIVAGVAIMNSLDTSNKVYDCLLRLPIYCMKKKEISYVIDMLRQYYKGY